MTIEIFAIPQNDRDRQRSFVLRVLKIVLNKKIVVGPVDLFLQISARICTRFFAETVARGVRKRTELKKNHFNETKTTHEPSDLLPCKTLK